MIPVEARSGLADIEVFRAASDVRHHITATIAGERHAISPVSGGFVVLRPRGFKEDMTSALGPLGWGRPVAFVDDSWGLARFSAAATDSELHVPQSSPSTVSFVVPERFRTRRIAAMEPRLQRRCPPSKSRHQTVYAVGTGPSAATDPQRVLRALGPVDDAIMSDWTYENTFKDVLPGTGVTPHVLPYQFDDFEANIQQVDRTLRNLASDGVDRVGLLIEGNPDTYDVLDGLSVAGRDVQVTPGIPIGLLAAAQNAELFHDDPLSHSFAYISGLHDRHGLPSEQFLGELTCYLSAGISCVLVEMYKGDIELALRAMALSSGKHVAVLMNDYFSPAESTVMVHDPRAAGTARVVSAARGGLSTMLITGEEPR
ncbi:hypothetical protein [Streptomyces sp. NPDC057438]|uniref:hypothetical protein n=1 Tax=Streptomyces sp. NPDC057438 TaxID=3346133 RepID=UPI0036C112B9